MYFVLVAAAVGVRPFIVGRLLLSLLNAPIRLHYDVCPLSALDENYDI